MAHDDDSKFLKTLEDELEDILDHFSKFHKLPYLVANKNGWAPPVDVYETIDQIIIIAEIGGVEKDDLNVVLNNNTLTIKGIRKEKTPAVKRNYYKMEINYGPFEKNILLPAKVDEENIIAELENGFLKIIMHKKIISLKNIDVNS